MGIRDFFVRDFYVAFYSDVIAVISEEKKRVGAVNIRMRVKKSEDEEKLVTIRVPCKFGKFDHSIYVILYVLY